MLEWFDGEVHDENASDIHGKGNNNASDQNSVK